MKKKYEYEQRDLVTEAQGRSLFLRHRGETKTPDLIDELVAEIVRLRGTSDSVAEALNSGDGTYKP